MRIVVLLYVCMCLMCYLCVFTLCLVWYSSKSIENRIKTRKAIELNRNRQWNAKSWCLYVDIVVGTESDLTRNSIVFISASIEIEASKIVAKYPKCVADQTWGNLIEQASRSASILPADRAAHSIGAPSRSAATFLFWKPINRAVLVKLSTFGKLWPTSLFFSLNLRFLSNR